MTDAPTPRDEDRAASAGAPALARRRGLRFVLMAHPTVQALRFLSKLVLAWFLTSEDLGEAMFAVLFALLAGQVAVFGADEVLVQAPRLDGALWRALRSWNARLGLAAAAGLAVLGLGLEGLGRLGLHALAWGALADHPLLGRLLLVLAPMVWLANRSVLPTALLVRAGDYRSVFLVDLAQVVALTLGTWIPAALGFGPFSLVLGWYANALAAVTVSEYAARRHVPADAGTQPLDRAARLRTRRFAGALCTASLASFGVDRLDGFTIGAGLGRAALGAYELAQQLSTAALGYATNLVERLVFPVLADEEHAHNLEAAWREALRIVLVFLIPLHVLLAAVGDELVVALFPERWRPSGPLVPWLALGAGARVLDVVASAALKAGGRGRAVSVLGWARLLALGAALAIGLPGGLVSVAQWVGASRALLAVAGAFTALRILSTSARPSARVPIAPSLVASVLWSAGVLAFAEWLRGAFAPLAFAGAVAALAGAAWILVRAAFDRAGLAREFAWLRSRVVEPRTGRRSSP